jgi:hypothetical protein
MLQQHRHITTGPGFALRAARVVKKPMDRLRRGPVGLGSHGWSPGQVWLRDQLALTALRAALDREPRRPCWGALRRWGQRPATPKGRADRPTERHGRPA